MATAKVAAPDSGVLLITFSGVGNPIDFPYVIRRVHCYLPT